MREIKFRAWIDNSVVKEMYYPENIQINSAAAVALQFTVGFEDTYPEKNGISDWQKEIKWMQYTGLKDKNEKEIYEGDIIQYTQHHFNTHLISTKRKEVKWKFDKWGVHETNAGISNIEVIGNIYENANLLTEE